MRYGFQPYHRVMPLMGNPSGQLGWQAWVFIGFHFLSIIVFWGLLIWLTLALVRHLQSRSTSGDVDAPLEILKSRYAKGEISKKEFEDMKKDIA